MRVCGKGMAGEGGPRGVNLEQISRQLLDAFFDARFDALPSGGVKRREPRRSALGAGIFVDLLEVIERNEEPVSLRVLQFQIFRVVASGVQEFKTLVASDPVVFMDDIVPGADVLDLSDRPPTFEFGKARAVPVTAENLGVRYHQETG